MHFQSLINQLLSFFSKGFDLITAKAQRISR
jgi:hypothetical protein